MIEKWFLNKKIESWSSFNLQQKQNILEKSRYIYYVKKNKGKLKIIVPFIILLLTGIAMVAITIINYLLSNEDGIFYSIAFIVILLISSEVISFYRVFVLFNEIKQLSVEMKHKK